MPEDSYSAVRSIPFTVLADALGIDLSKFKTRKGGSEHFGNCPIHKAKLNNTSFSYHSDGRYQCFSCNAKGRGGVDLVKAAKGINFQAAVAFLEPLVSNIAPTQKAPPGAVSEASGAPADLKPYTGSYEKFQVPCPWLEERIPDKAIREKYGVFCYNNPARKSAYSGRVMIPIKDVEGAVYGYLGRHTATEGNSGEQIPKYLFPKYFPKSKFAFGAAEIKAGGLPLPLKLLYVSESPWTVMRFAMMGLPCVALYGWSASPEQIEIMAGLTRAVCYLPDRNKAGQESAGVVQAIARRLYVHAPELPAGIDDAERLTKLEVLAL